MGAQGLDAFGGSIQKSADTANASMTTAQKDATAPNATPGDMIAFQLAAAKFGIVMSALSNGLKAYTDGMKTPADNAR